MQKFLAPKLKQPDMEELTEMPPTPQQLQKQKMAAKLQGLAKHGKLGHGLKMASPWMKMKG